MVPEALYENPAARGLGGTARSKRTGVDAGSWLERRDEPASFAEVAHVPEGFTMREMKNAQRKMFARFYLRPATFFRLLGDIRSSRHAYYIFKRMFRWMLFSRGGAKGS